MTTCFRRLTLLLATAMLTLPASGSARAAESHEHLGTGSAVAQLKLDDGRKWPTDASLRSGMSGIRTVFDEHHPAIHAGDETPEQYVALAARIETLVNGIVANCHLAPAADANLHYVIADLLQGVSLMRGTDPARSRHDGAALVHGALLAYGRYFDDPDFRP